MKSTLARLKNLKFKGATQVPWAERRVNEYVDFIEEQVPDLARQLEKMPFAKFHGSPHASPKRNDPWHASVTLRRKDDFKGSGLSLHVYPDGTVVPSKPEFPVITLAPATRDEVGEENSCWLNPEYVADWQTSNQVNASAGSVKGKGKAEAGSSNSSSSKQYKSSSRKHGSSSSRKGKEKAEASGEYSKDPDTGALYRYAENGAVVYLDFDSQREFYCDEQGQAVWL